MSLSGFEIAVGGITSIPVVSGLVLLGYKAFGEQNLDSSKLKPKTKPPAKKDVSVAEKKPVKSQKEPAAAAAAAAEAKPLLEQTATSLESIKDFSTPKMD